MRRADFQAMAAAGLAVCLLAQTALPAMAETDWYTLSAHGRSIGQVRVQSYPSQGDQWGAVTEVSHSNRFTRAGNPFNLNATSRFVENPVSGKPLSFSYEYDLGPQRFMEARGSLQGDFLDLRMIRDNQVASGKAPISGAQFLFPGGAGIQKVYRAHYHDPPGARFSFQTLNLGVSPTIVNNRVTLLGREKLALAGGEKKPLGKFEVQNPVHAGSKVLEWRDAQGKLYKAQSLGADGMEMVYANRRQSVHSAESLDLVTSSAVITNAIPQPRITTEALYRISPLNGESVPWDKAFPESFNQDIVDGAVSSLQSVTPNAIYLKVLQKEPSDSLAVYPIPQSAIYLASTPYVQAHDPDIQAVAMQVVGLDPATREKRAYFAARKLQQWVYRNIAQKDLNLGFASAKDTLISQEGDCTEHAVLLAALARSLGIPARVAVGLIYQSDGEANLGRFVYHMWDEVYIGTGEKGEWTPLDATNPEPVTDATHIKIADSALTDVNDLLTLTQQVVGLSGKIKISVLKALSPHQSTLAIGKQSGALSFEIPQVDIERVDIRKLSQNAIARFQIPLPPPSLSLETADGLFTYGVEQLARGNAEAAQAAFQKAVSKLHRPVEFYLMGEKLAAIENYSLAASAFRQAQVKNPAFGPLVDSWMSAYLPARFLPEALNNRFLLAIQAGSPASLKAVMDQVPDFAPAYRQYGEQVGGREGIEALRRAVALAPENFHHQETLGDALVSQSRPAEAKLAYQEALRVLGKTAFPRSKNWAQALRGKLEIAAGSALLVKNHRSAAGWLAIGKGLMLQNRTDEANQAFINAESLQPGFSEARLYQFQLALAQSDWQRIYRLKDAGASGGNALAAQLMAEYGMKNRQYPLAAAFARKAIALSPHAPAGYLTLSEIDLRRGELETGHRAVNLKAAHRAQWDRQALADLRQGIPLMTQSLDRQQLSLALGQLLLKANRAAEAQKLAQDVITANSINGEAYALKGSAQFYAGQDAAAQESLNNALAINPNQSDTLLALGHVAMEQGQDSQAVSFYQKAYKANPASDEAALYLRRAMTRLQIAGRKPPEYWELSGDEHDYLVQIMYLLNRIKRNTRDFLQKTQQNTPTGDHFTVQAIDKIQDAYTLIDQSYDRQLALYRQANAMTPPARFQRFHYGTLLVYYNMLESHNVALDTTGFYTPEEMTAKSRNVSGSLNHTMQLKADYTAMLNDLLSHLSDGELSRLALESGSLFPSQDTGSALRENLINSLIGGTSASPETASRPAPASSGAPAGKESALPANEAELKNMLARLKASPSSSAGTGATAQGAPKTPVPLVPREKP